MCAAQSARCDLQAAGLTSARRRCERAEDGNYRGLAAIRYMPALLFGAFGLAKWLPHERSKATLRQQLRETADAKQRRRNTREHVGGQLWLKAMTNGVNRAGPAVSASDGMDVSTAAEFERRVRSALARSSRPIVLSGTGSVSDSRASS